MASPGAVVIQFLVDAKKAASDTAKLATQFGKVDTEADALDRTLDSLESELDSIGRASADLKTDMQKAEVGFDSVGDEAEQAADRVRRAANDMAAGVRDGGSKIDTETSGIKRNMADAGRESGNEFIGNMAEGIGSGSGSVTDVVQGTLGGLTNLAATLGGPVGVAAAGAAALVGTVFNKVKQEAEKAKAQAEELKDALREVAVVSSETGKQITWDTWLAQLDTADGLLDEVTDAMRVANITGKEMQGAITGDPAAQQAVITKLKNVGTTIADNVKKGKPLTEDQRNYLSNQGRIHEELRRMGINLGDIEDDHRDIALLTGNMDKDTKAWYEALKDVKTTVQQVDSELEGLPNVQSITLKLVGPGGQPINKGNLDRLTGGTWSVGGAPSAPVPVLMVNQTAAPPPTATVQVHVTEEQIYRAVERLVMRGNARNGRRVIVG